MYAWHALSCAKEAGRIGQEGEAGELRRICERGGGKKSGSRSAASESGGVARQVQARSREAASQSQTTGLLSAALWLMAACTNVKTKHVRVRVRVRVCVGEASAGAISRSSTLPRASCVCGAHVISAHTNLRMLCHTICTCTLPCDVWHSEVCQGPAQGHRL